MSHSYINFFYIRSVLEKKRGKKREIVDQNILNNKKRLVALSNYVVDISCLQITRNKGLLDVVQVNTNLSLKPGVLNNGLFQINLLSENHNRLLLLCLLFSYSVSGSGYRRIVLSFIKPVSTQYKYLYLENGW